MDFGLAQNVLAVPMTAKPGTLTIKVASPGFKRPVLPLSLLDSLDSKASLSAADRAAVWISRNPSSTSLPAPILAASPQSQRVTLTGLPQGPGAAKAAKALAQPLEAPQLWTMLLWSVSRCVCFRRSLMFHVDRFSGCGLC